MVWFLSALFLLACAVYAEPAAGGGDVSGPGPTVICRDAGAGGYQAFPDLARLRSGELLCVFYAGYGHVSVPTEALPRGGRIAVIRSSDDGKTWSAPRTVVDTPIDDRDPHISEMADGTLVVSFFTRLPTGAVDVYVVKSRSAGKRWGAPVLAARGKACSAKARELRDGSLILPVYGPAPRGTGRRFDSAVVRSRDGGATWEAPVALPLNSGHSHDEADVIELPGGKLLALIRPCMCRTASTDCGRTWSDTEPAGFEGHAPCLLRISKGVLLVAHRIPGTALYYSLDDGATWKGPVQIDSVTGAYPGLAELPDGRILCVYYEEGKGSAIRQRIFRADRDGIHL